MESFVGMGWRSYYRAELGPAWIATSWEINRPQPILLAPADAAVVTRALALHYADTLHDLRQRGGSVDYLPSG